MPSTTPVVDASKELRAAERALAPALARFKKAAAVDPAKVKAGALTDYLYALHQADKQLAALTAPFDDVLGPTVKAIEDHFIKTLAVGESSGVQGMTARVQVRDSKVPVVKAQDWLSFLAYVAKTKQWDLLQHSISKEAVRERWKAKKQVKFVGTFTAKKVSCTKLGGKAGK
jgi:hypothetical protein